MCDHRVIESVRRRMISRRGLFRGGAALAAGAAAGPLPALAQGSVEVLDLTHTLDEDFPTFGGEPGLSREKPITIERDGYNLYVMTINEHTGTHIDAPLHFSEDGTPVDELAVENLVVPLCVVDIRARAAEHADAQLTPDDLQAWIDANGEIPDRACVAMLSGWGEKAPDQAFRGADADGALHFPGFHIEAAEMLLETGAAAIGVDTMSLDYGASPDFAVHYRWLPAGRYGIEALANLERLPAAGATLVVGAPKVRGGTGGPARIFALT
jgi:kynurenine formamidase